MARTTASERRPAANGGLILVLATASLLAAVLPAQTTPTVRAAFGPRAARAGVPAVEWLCSHHLPQRAGWPHGLDPALPFVLRLTPAGLTIQAGGPQLPDDVAAAGSCTIEGSPAMLWTCSIEGAEDWFVPREVRIPAAWSSLLRDLGALSLGAPRRLDAPVVIGHLAGPQVDGDPRGELLRLGSGLCGEVTWTAWTTSTHLRVRGRGDGGLLMPAALLFLASEQQAPPRTMTTPALPLRAFAARDGDRAEAARQMSRDQDARSEAALRAMLYADDATALAAIDALVHRQDAAPLPQIVAAAQPEAPWTSVAAADAVRALWSRASPAVRQETRRAIRKSQSIELRQLDLDVLPTGAVVPPPERAEPDTARIRALVLLGLLAVGVYGLWLRERRLC